MSSYVPTPIDTAHVRVPDQLHDLIERLAENNHDNWARQRLSEGWRWGPVRDDAKREHPDLVPYADLTEGEKEYDRITVSEALKAIIHLGFEIRPTASRP